MSIASTNYNAQTESLEIIIKFFTDDLEKALEQSSSESLFLATEKEAKQVDSLLNLYLNQHFKLRQNEKALKINFLGKEAERDYTFAYLEIENFDENNTTTITNTLLIYLFENQVNELNYKNGKKSKSISMHKDLIRSEF